MLISVNPEGQLQLSPCVKSFNGDKFNIRTSKKLQIPTNDFVEWGG